MKRSWFCVQLVAILVVVLAATVGQTALAQTSRSEPPKAASLPKIVFGTSGGVEFVNLPFRVAERKGFFKDEGLDIEIFHFKGGGQLISGFATGRIQMGFTSFASALHGMVQGVPITSVAEVSKYPVFWGLMVPAKSPIRALQDLKPGAKIAITGEGAHTHYLTLMLLNKIGLEASKVTLVPLGTGPQFPAAVRAAQVDAALAFSPTSLELEQDGSARFVVRMEEVLPTFTSSGIHVQNDFIRKHPEAVRRVLRAYRKAVLAVWDNRPQMLAWMKEWYGMEGKIADRMYEAGLTNFNADGRMSVQALQFYVDTAVQYGFLPRPIAVDRAIDPSFTPIP